MIQVFPAQHSDIKQMIEVSGKVLVKTNREKFTAEDFAKQGFLIVQLTEEVARKFIDNSQSHFACVAKEGEEVVGYLTSCDVKESGIIFPEEMAEFKRIKDQKIFYHKQIARKPGMKNVGQKLLLAMFDEVKSRGYSHVLCRIVHTPFFNEVSINFHKKFGFREIGLMEDDGATLGVYLKEL